MRVGFFDKYFVNVLLYRLAKKYIWIGTRLGWGVSVKYLLGIAWNAVEIWGFFYVPQLKPQLNKSVFYFSPSGVLSCLIFANCSKSFIICANDLLSFVLHTEFWFLMKFHTHFHSHEPNAFVKTKNNCMCLGFGRKKYNLAYSNCIDLIKLFISSGKNTTVENFTLSGFSLVSALNFH